MMLMLNFLVHLSTLNSSKLISVMNHFFKQGVINCLRRITVVLTTVVSLLFEEPLLPYYLFKWYPFYSRHHGGARVHAISGSPEMGAVAWGVVFCDVCNHCGCGCEGGCCGITV